MSAVKVGDRVRALVPAICGWQGTGTVVAIWAGGLVEVRPTVGLRGDSYTFFEEELEAYERPQWNS